MSALSNSLTNQTQTTMPLWQAPLPFNLIAAENAGQISAVGGFGMIRVGEHSNSDSLSADIAAYQRHHDRPTFCFYHPLPITQTPANSDALHQLLVQLFAQAVAQSESKLPPPEQPDDFNTLLERALNAKPRAIGFARGLPNKADLTRIKAADCLTFAICHSVAEAVVAEDNGMDIIVLQGNDAGGLHSRFPNKLPAQPQSAMTLLKQAREYLTKPIVVWGDFPQGRDVVAALISGAEAVMIDRPLLSCKAINLTDTQHKQLAVLNETHSRISEQFSALPMRLLPNFLSERLHSDDLLRESALHTILQHRPEWRPLCVSPTQCHAYLTIKDCFDGYREDMANYLA